MKSIDVVIPIFNEEKIAQELILRLQKATGGLNYQFNFLLVDDGSTDDTLKHLLAIQANEPRLKIIKLSRNWGNQSANNAGLDHSSGDALIFMDGDLEDPPELFPMFIKKWEEGNEVVYAVKNSRKRTMIERITFALFYKVLQRFSEVKVDQQAGMFSLLDRKVVNELKKCSEKNKFYVGLRFFMGFKQARIDYHREKRFAGEPKQTFRKLLNYGLNAFFSFSFLPIRILTYLGLFLILTIVTLGTLFVIGKTSIISTTFFEQIRNLPDWTSIILAIFFVLGIQIIFLGILGEYIARIFDEVRSRPFYIVDHFYEPEKKAEED